jgi:hypothetical protein
VFIRSLASVADFKLIALVVTTALGIVEQIKPSTHLALNFEGIEVLANITSNHLLYHEVN